MDGDIRIVIQVLAQPLKYISLFGELKPGISLPFY